MIYPHFFVSLIAGKQDCVIFQESFEEGCLYKLGLNIKLNGKYLEKGRDICICKSDLCNGGKALALLNGTNSLTINHGIFGIFIFSILVYIVYT